MVITVGLSLPIPPVMRALSVWAVLLLGAVGCEAQRTPENSWEYATPMEVGLEPGLMAELEEAVTTGRFTNLHGVVVVKGGRLVLDAYAPGVDDDDLHYTASVTKSVGSLLLGIALDRGFLRRLEDGVLDLGLSDLFPEHGAILGADSRKGDIRLRHVLSMTAGLEWDEDSYPYNDPRNDWVRVRGADDPVRLVLEQAVDAPPGSEFVYSGGMSALLGALLDRAGGGSPRALAERELFDPLGISAYVWWDLGGGLIDVPGGLHLRPRDMAKIGQMCLQGGMWNGRQIVSRAWVAESTKPHVSNRYGPDYGLHWWVGDHDYRGRSAHVFMASGHGGQRIFVVPEFNLVVVVVQQVFDNPMADANNLSIMSQYILPAAGGPAAGDAPPQPDPDDLRALVGTYRSGRGVFTIELREGALWALAEDEPPMQLDPVGPFRFRGTALGLIEVDFVFDIGADGTAVGGRASFGFTQDEFLRV